MTKITEIEDRGATIAWCPIGEHADVIALGAKVRQFCSIFYFKLILVFFKWVFVWFSTVPGKGNLIPVTINNVYSTVVSACHSMWCEEFELVLYDDKFEYLELFFYFNFLYHTVHHTVILTFN